MNQSTSDAVVTDLTRAHYVPLDGLRGLAILLVMLYHFCLPHKDFHGRKAGALLQLAQGGWMGVDLFFVLSGFLITGILLETRRRPHYFRNFLARRFLRIWPLYYASLLVLLIVMPMVLSKVPAELQGMRDKQAWFWLYGANWLFALEGGFTRTSGGYLWSLAVEEQFYLLWPFVVYALSERALLRVSLALLAVSLAARIVLVNLGVSTGALYTMTFTHLDGLAVGSSLAVCLRSPQLAARAMRWLPIAFVVGMFGLIAVRVADRDLFYWSKAMATFGYTFAAILFGALLLWVLNGKRTFGVARFFSTAFMCQAGRYSYALYMLHVPVASVLFPLMARQLEHYKSIIGYDGVFIACGVGSFAISWLLAVASWHLFEKHVLALKRYFNYAPDDDARVTAAVPRSAVHTPHG